MGMFNPDNCSESSANASSFMETMIKSTFGESYDNCPFLFIEFVTGNPVSICNL